jgi:predicted ATPase
VRNLLSYGPETAPLSLGPLNVFIGPNGSGKSNLIEALALLRATPGDVRAVIRLGGGVREWLWKGGAVKTVAYLVACWQSYATRNRRR